MFRRNKVSVLGIPLESRILRLAFITPERFVALEDLRGVLVCFDLNGARLWERKIKRTPFAPNKIRVAHGRIWIDCRNRILRFDFDGNEKAPLRVALRPDEAVGWYVVGEDSVAVSLYRDLDQPREYPDDEEGESEPPLDLSGRVVRLNLDGTVRWSCNLPIEKLVYEGIGYVSAKTQGRQPDPPWRPSSWKCDGYVNDGLLLSGDVLLASFIEISSGIGFSYAVRWSDGVLLWTTEMLPFSRRAICGEGEFAFSVGGYGESRTFVVNARGEILREWKGNGALCVGEEGDLWLVENARYVGSPCAVWQLKAKGEAHRCATIVPGSGSTVALNSDGVIFWRDGQLRRIDFNGRTTVLNPDVGSPKSSVLSGMLLNEEGTLVFSTAGSGAPHEGNVPSMLWIAQEKVAPLLETAWPCGEGNPQGNPVWREKR